MNEFFTWAALGTYAGAVLATTLVTQLLKGVGFISKIPTRVFSLIVAAIIMLAATFFNTGLTLSNGILCIINAVVVSLASNGAFDAVSSTNQ